MNIKPMLAYKAGIKPIDFSEQVYIQPKLDGVRCLFTKDGAFSRTGKQFMNVQHIENELQPLFNDYPNLILDGELYNHALKNDFEKIISLVRKQKPNPFDRSEAYEFVEFHWYDIIDDDNDILFIDRSKFIHELLRDFFPDADAHHVFPLVTLRVDSLDKARAIHDANLAGGFEGSIIRLNKVYECKRSYNLQKFKDFSDKEATIIGHVEGKGKRAGTHLAHGFCLVTRSFKGDLDYFAKCLFLRHYSCHEFCAFCPAHSNRDDPPMMWNNFRQDAQWKQ